VLSDGVDGTLRALPRKCLLLLFRETCVADVTAVDQPGRWTAPDPVSGETVSASESDELAQGVTGVAWSEITMTLN
jgi:hypothetical protein